MTTTLEVQALRNRLRDLLLANSVERGSFTLASGRRVDVMALSPSGQLWIVEIKSSLEDFRADLKWPEYRDFCDRLYFAITTELMPEIMSAEAGLIIADAWGAEIQRDPSSDNPPPGTIQCTWGWCVSADPQECSTMAPAISIHVCRTGA